MLKHPLPIYPYVLLVVAGRSPNGLVAFGVSTGLEQVPGARGFVSVHLDHRVEHHMDGEGQPAGRVLEERTDGFPPVVAAALPPVPHCIFSEKLG